jgi:hypothetical protein
MAGPDNSMSPFCVFDKAAAKRVNRAADRSNEARRFGQAALVLMFSVLGVRVVAVIARRRLDALFFGHNVREVVRIERAGGYERRGLFVRLLGLRS